MREKMEGNIGQGRRGLVIIFHGSTNYFFVQNLQFSYAIIHDTSP